MFWFYFRAETSCRLTLLMGEFCYARRGVFNFKRNQTLFSGSLSQAQSAKSSNNFHFSRISHTNHFPKRLLGPFVVVCLVRDGFMWNSLNVNNNNRVWKTSSCCSWSFSAPSFFLPPSTSRFRFFSFVISKNPQHHNVIGVREGPRERTQREPLGNFPRNHRVECWSFSSLARSCLACAWGRAKAAFVCPFRSSSNHGRPIVIYQSFCLLMLFAILSCEFLKRSRKTPNQRLIIAARNFNYHQQRKSEGETRNKTNRKQ